MDDRLLEKFKILYTDFSDDDLSYILLDVVVQRHAYLSAFSPPVPILRLPFLHIPTIEGNLVGFS